ncbi:SOS response-associated peptidase [Sphingobacterium kitahiroshimense]|uniref:SOS response-associated peptidase n=1 Tax=Sphingobacterium sp. B16(2022) TaxID=2914044 RepID=UPI00143CB358|nr:SOS response-associated peptidase family protein [Sphingobacterium sp. B16(2022)]NJI75848.1 SOS response-associated peptidase [Sphingobacterium sp. B16(2022)]
MCYHVSTPDITYLKKARPEKEVIFEGSEIYHVSGFARPYLPVTLNNQNDKIVQARWKLIPFWVKTEDDAKKYANTLNADSGTIFEKASYKNYIMKNRGLLYVNGFYEPHKVAGQKDTENYYIYTPSKEIFTLGIVFSDFKDYETGDTYPTFSIITTEANPLLAEIHNEKKRMPLIISQQDEDAWLNATNKEDIIKMMKPYGGELGSHQVVRVTDPKLTDTNHPEIQRAI